ncbi:MAG: hypothetical protein IPP80_12480 [Ignavibacteria bacterium]|nr:hypothetical protein [Ignavibacteria bacterium]
MIRSSLMIQMERRSSTPCRRYNIERAAYRFYVPLQRNRLHNLHSQSNGLIGLGSTPIPPSATNALTSLTTPALAPFWDDLPLGQFPVMIQNTGQANARSLHITWRVGSRTLTPTRNRLSPFMRYLMKQRSR